MPRTKDPVAGLGTVGGGIASAIVGSALIVAVATAMALLIRGADRDLPDRVLEAPYGAADPAGP
jgi:hypothetical protein